MLCLVEGNHAGKRGGAIFNDGPSTHGSPNSITVRRSTFSDR